jgi:hypothetical protein
MAEIAEIKENVREMEKSISNIVSKVKLMIETIKSVNKTPYSMYIVSIFMISYEDEKKFIKKYDYHLYLFNALLSFFRVEALNKYNNDLFNVFVELLYETVGRKIISTKFNICYNELNIELFRILIYSSPEENKDFFDLIEKEFYVYMNNLYGIIFRSSLSNEENTMIHLDYILRNEFSIYSLDYMFFEELHEFMVIKYEIPVNNNNNNNIINIINHIQHNNEGDNNEFEEDDIYS